MKTKILQPPYVEVEWGGGRYSPGESSVLMQIVPYSSSIYTVFHSVIYNSVWFDPYFYVLNNLSGLPLNRL